MNTQKLIQDTRKWLELHTIEASGDDTRQFINTLSWVIDAQTRITELTNELEALHSAQEISAATPAGDEYEYGYILRDRHYRPGRRERVWTAGVSEDVARVNIEDDLKYTHQAGDSTAYAILVRREKATTWLPVEMITGAPHG